MRYSLLIAALALVPLLVPEADVVSTALPLDDGPCATPQHAQLDFWTGTWELSWPGGQGGTPPDGEGRGTNTITRTLDGCVVHEQFESSTGYQGWSVSVYDRRAEQWKQTWVDTQGNYMTFTGGLDDDGTMALYREPFVNPQGQRQLMRMTWTDVSDSALTWHWQRSLDDGATWTDVWTIQYRRAP